MEIRCASKRTAPVEQDTNQALATGKAAMALMAGSQLSSIKQTYPDADLNNSGFVFPLVQTVRWSPSLVAMWLTSMPRLPLIRSKWFLLPLVCSVDEGEVKARFEARD